VSGDTLHILYQDDGPGVPAADKEKIFDMGYDAGPLRGLFLLRELLAFTGIGIREIGVPGRGAVFDIQVPRNKFRKEH